MRIVSGIALVLGFVAAGCAPLGMIGGMGGPALQLSPSQILQHRDTLKLSSDQVTRLERLAAGSAVGERDDVRATQQARAQQREERFSAAAPDTAAVRVAAEKLLLMQAFAQARRIADAAAVRAILTRGQLEQAMRLPLCPKGDGMNHQP